MSSVPEETTKSWYSQHPLVSTFLWVLGSKPNGDLTSSEIPISSRGAPSSRLHWKDEYGNGKIAEIISEDEEHNKNNTGLERQNSGVPLRRNISTTLSTMVSTIFASFFMFAIKFFFFRIPT